jgi:hypothetical protein
LRAVVAALFVVEPRFVVAAGRALFVREGVLVLLVRDEPLALFVREVVERPPDRVELDFLPADREALRAVEPRPVEDLVLADFLLDVPRVDFRVVAIVVLQSGGWIRERPLVWQDPGAQIRYILPLIPNPREAHGAQDNMGTGRAVRSDGGVREAERSEHAPR